MKPEPRDLARDVEQGEDVSDVFTRKSSVYALKNSKGKIAVNTAVKRDVTLALVGFHIGGVVENHPEMIWATFEPRSSAPNVEPGTRPTDIVSTEDYSFYTAKTEYTNCNDPSGVTLNEATQKLSPVTQVCRQYKFGNAKNDPSTSTVPDGTNPENQYALDNNLNNSILSNITTNSENIVSLNTIVWERLDDVFANYREVGAIWFAGKKRSLRTPNSFLPVSFAAAIISSAASIFTARGFSHITSLPARSAWHTRDAWLLWRVTIIIASTLSSASMSWISVDARAKPNFR